MTVYHSYNLELKTALTQVMDVLNNIVVERFETADQQIPNQRILVPCVYGSRSRLLKSVESTDQQVRLPISTIQLAAGPNRDPSRVHSLNDAILTSADGEYNFLENKAVPVDLDYSYDIYTKFNDDLDQVMTNIIARFNPDVFVAWRCPADPTKILKSQMVWNGGFQVTSPDEISETEPWRFHAATSFVFRTWIFPGTKRLRDLGLGNAKPIAHINIYDPFNNQHSYSGYVPVISNDGFWGQNCWYAVERQDIFTRVLDAAKAGLIDPKFKDCLPVTKDFPDTYFIIPSATLSGVAKNLLVKEDLDELIAADDADIHLEIIVDSENASILQPESFRLDDIAFWKTIWTRMSSGDLALATVSSPDSPTIQSVFMADGLNGTLGIFKQGGDLEVLKLPSGNK